MIGLSKSVMYNSNEPDDDLIDISIQIPAIPTKIGTDLELSINVGFLLYAWYRITCKIGLI